MRHNCAIMPLTHDVRVPEISELMQGTVRDLVIFTIPEKSCSRRGIRLVSGPNSALHCVLLNCSCICEVVSVLPLALSVGTGVSIPCTVLPSGWARGQCLAAST